MIQIKRLEIEQIPAIVWGKSTSFLYIYVHGKYGYKEEAERFAHIADRNGWQVLSFDLPGHGERKGEMERFTPWDIEPELELIWRFASRHWDHIALYATSIGAWFSLLSYATSHCRRLSLFLHY